MEKIIKLTELRKLNTKVSKGEKVRVSAERRLAASSKLLRVRVEASKKRVVTTCPCKVGTFLVRRDNTSRKLKAVCKTVSYSVGLKSAKDKMWRRVQTGAVMVNKNG